MDGRRRSCSTLPSSFSKKRPKAHDKGNFKTFQASGGERSIIFSALRELYVPASINHGQLSPTFDLSLSSLSILPSSLCPLPSHLPSSRTLRSSALLLKDKETSWSRLLRVIFSSEPLFLRDREEIAGEFTRNGKGLQYRDK